MSKVSKYSILFYSGEQGYQNCRAQISLSDADGNTLALVRFKDPGMPYELDTETDGIITMHLPTAIIRASSTPFATRRPTSTIRSEALSCSRS